MKTVWTKGLNDEEKKIRQEKVKQAREVLDILTEMLDHKEAQARKALKPNLMDAGWPYFAADNNGYIRAVQEIKTILQE